MSANDPHNPFPLDNSGGHDPASQPSPVNPSSDAPQQAGTSQAELNSEQGVFDEFKKSNNEGASMKQAVQGMLLGDRASIATAIFNIGGDSQKSVDRILQNPTLDVQPIDPRTAEFVRRIFVTPDQYAEAKTTLAKENLVILVGGEGMGKQTTALSLALDYFPEEHIYHTDSTTQFERLISLRMDRRACFILDGARKSLLVELDDFRLQKLRAHLQKANCQLVITTTWQETYTVPTLTPLLIRVAAQRSGEMADKIIKRHLEHWTSSDPDTVSYDKALSLYQKPEVKAILGDIQCNRDLRDMAFGLYRAVKGETTIEEVIDRFSTLSKVERDGWLHEFRTPQEWAFLLSMACFNGARREHIERMADILKSLSPEIFDPPPKESDPPRPLTPIGELYQRARVHLSHTETYQILAFDRRGYAYEVLNYFWEEYPIMQEIICDWLLMIGKKDLLTAKFAARIAKQSDTLFAVLKHTIEEIGKVSHLRFRAAAAAGELARHGSFDLIEENVLRYWIETGDIYCQQLVGFAIAEPALRDERLLPVVMGRLRRWAYSDEDGEYYFDGRYRRTAALAYGIIGLKHPAEALRNLRQIIEDVSKTKNPFAVYESVIHALQMIFDYGSEDPMFYALVLQALANWSHEMTPNSAVANQSLLAFLIIAALDRTEKREASWLTMLVQAHRNSALRGIIGGLMRRAINARQIRSIATEALTIWINHAKDIQQSQRVLYALIEIMYNKGGDNEKARLIHFLKGHCAKRNEFACQAQQSLSSTHL